MDFDAITNAVIDFVRNHQAWAAPIVGVLAFCESLAILALFVPATVMLVGIGALLGGGGYNLGSATFWIICLAGAVGAAVGDWVSYEFGAHFEHRIKTMWPLKRSPHLIERAENFIRRWGVWGVFFGRFFGPLRALVPLVAGIFALPRARFQVANVASALIWSFGLLAPGAGLVDWFKG